MIEGFFWVFIEVKQGYSYHIKDSFFSYVSDSALMSNKENGSYRPHYYAIEEIRLLYTKDWIKNFGRS